MKSRIDINNYEAFLLDYMEGRLGNEEKAELLAFFHANPELGDFYQVTSQEFPTLNNTAAENNGNWSVLKKDFTSHEEQILNYLEGQLDAAGIAAFEDELKRNPGLASETVAYRKVYLKNQPEITFENKSALYRSEDDVLLVNSVLRYTEGDLNLQEQQAFEKELQTNPALKKEVAAYAATKLSVDAGVVYPNKQELKKQTKVFVLFSLRNMAAVAAAILLLIGFFVLLIPGRHVTDTPVVVSENKSGKYNHQANQATTQPAPVVVEETTKFRAEKVRPNAMEVSHKPQNLTSVTDTTQSKLAKQEAIEPVNKIQKNNTPRQDSSVLAEVTKTLATGFETQIVKTETANVTGAEKNALAAIAEPAKPIAALQEFDDDDDEADDRNKKGATPGFWKRAVKIAQDANGMGLKSVYGESGKNSVLLSFNEISVEKK